MKTIFSAAIFGLLCGISQAALVCQFGILDLNANGGINPNTGNPWQAGDQYRLAFYTDGKLNASSADPAVYNAFVTAQANLSNLGDGSIKTSTGWVAMVYTTTTSVKSNTGTGDLTGGSGIGGAGVPIFAMDGKTAIARNNADIWDGWSNPFASNSTIRLVSGSSNLNSSGQSVTASQSVYYSPFLDQYGLGDTADVHGETVWTGFTSGGNAVAGQEVGSVSGVGGSVGNTNWGSSNANNTTRVFNRGNQSNTTNSNSFYALSPLLTIVEAVPEPSTALLSGIGCLAILRRRRV